MHAQVNKKHITQCMAVPKQISSKISFIPFLCPVTNANTGSAKLFKPEFVSWPSTMPQYLSAY